MADYADTASLSSSRPERSAQSSRDATSPSFDASELPAALDSGNAANTANAADPQAHASGHSRDEGLPASASAPVTGEAAASVRQGTLSGFEAPEPAQAVPAIDDEAAAASPVAGATSTRRVTRAKRATAQGSADAALSTVAATQEVLAGSEAAVSLEPQPHATPHENAAALASIDATPEPSPERVSEATAIADAPFSVMSPERVEPTSLAPEGTPQHTLAQRFDALHGVLAEQRRMAAASSRQLKWVLGVASAAVLASVGFGIAQSVRLDRLANESRAEQARLEEFILKQQSTLEDLTQRLATPVAAPAAEAPSVAPVRAAAAPATPAPTRHAAARPARAAHAHRTQKPAH